MTLRTKSESERHAHLEQAGDEVIGVDGQHGEELVEQLEEEDAEIIVDILNSVCGAVCSSER